MDPRKVDDDDDESSLSDCITVASPTPPPVLLRKPAAAVSSTTSSTSSSAAAASAAAAPRKAPPQKSKGGLVKGKKASPTARASGSSSGNSSSSTTSKSKPPVKTTLANSKMNANEKSKLVIPDSEGDDSDEDLMELSELMPSKKRVQTNPPSKAGKSTAAGSRKSGSGNGKGVVREMPLSPRKPAPAPATGPSLAARDFLKDTMLQRQEDLDFEKALLRLEGDDDSDFDLDLDGDLDGEDDGFWFGFGDKGGNGRGKLATAKKDILDTAIGDEAGEKVLAMLERREAWKVEYTWHFWEKRCAGRSRVRNPFPVDEVPELLGGLKDPATRYELFLTGYVQDIVALSPNLPENLVSWILEESILEKRQHLSYSYIKSLESCPAQVANVLTSEKIRRLFELLGGRKQALEVKSVVQLVESNGNGNRIRDLWNLKLLVKFLGTLAVHLTIPSVITAVDILIRLSIDESVNKFAEPLTDIEASIHSLLTSIPEDQWDTASTELLRTLTETFTDPKCQIRVLKTLPVFSPRTHLFRRRLALAAIFSDASYLTKPYPHLVEVGIFSTLLQKPIFKVKAKTDYVQLKSLIEMLDIAIDDGATSSLPGGQSQEVEAVAATLKDLSSNIKDAGMASLDRTEAKQVIELAQFRLQYSVAKRRKGGKVGGGVGGTIPGRMRQATLPFGRK